MPKSQSSLTPQGNDRKPRTSTPDNVDDLDLDPSFHRPAALFGSQAPNRDYYPLPQHQMAWDALERTGEERPVNLNCLTEGEDNANPPPHTVVNIVKCAILGSPNRRLTLKEIRVAFRRRFHYYAHAPSGSWCNTVRFVLSTTKDLVKIPRQRTVGDSGSWWIVKSDESQANLETAPGLRTNKKKKLTSTDRGEPRGNPTSLQRRAQEDPWVNYFGVNDFQIQNTRNFSPTQLNCDRLSYREYSSPSAPTLPLTIQPLPTRDYQYFPYSTPPSGTYRPQLPSCHSLIQNVSGDRSHFDPLPGLRTLGLLNLSTERQGEETRVPLRSYIVL